MDEAIEISSFVLRFVRATSPEGAVRYHGSIRHIQSNQVVNFSRWEDALAFIETYVPLDMPEAARRLQSPDDLP
jgi:hypothetical protein